MSSTAPEGPQTRRAPGLSICMAATAPSSSATPWTTTPGLGTDAKHLGVQDGFEKSLKAIVTVSAGSDLLSGGMGLIDSVNTLYLPQIVVDAEIVAMIRRLLGEVEFTHETMAREMIERVGIGGNFLKEKETRQRIRGGEHFVPRIASRLPYDAWQAQGTTELDAAVERVEEILAARAQRAPHLTDDQLAALRAICEMERTSADVGY